MSDYISPEEIDERRTRAQEDRAMRRDMLFLWVLAVIIIVLLPVY